MGNFKAGDRERKGRRDGERKGKKETEGAVEPQ